MADLSKKVNAMGNTATLVSGDSTLISKINEIAQDQGRGSHGRVTLTNQETCEHWRSGDNRIFGRYDEVAGKLDLMGLGWHTGRGNSSYKVDWHDGTRPKAQTS